MSAEAIELEHETLPSLAGGRVPFVLVTGGKGGVGKTLLTANLGVELARSGARVLLVDLDFGLANLHVALRVSAPRTIEDVLARRARLSDCIVEGPDGVHILPASSGTVAMGRLDHAQRARLFAALAAEAHAYDLILGDSPAGIGPDVLAFAAAAERVLLVTTPDPTALTDAYGLIKALSGFADERGHEVPTPEIVVNCAASAEEAESVAKKLGGVCERFLSRSPHCAGWLPQSVEIARSAAEQRPFVRATGEGLAQHCMRRLAARLARLSAGTRRVRVPQGAVKHDR